MARSCKWSVEALHRGEWLRTGCYRGAQAARKAALEYQAETQRDVSVVQRNADGSIRATWGRDHQRRQWRKHKR